MNGGTNGRERYSGGLPCEVKDGIVEKTMDAILWQRGFGVTFEL
jgi:hypothetical protein